MSAFDPKRTSSHPLLPHLNLLPFELNWRRARVLEGGYLRATARFHQDCYCGLMQPLGRWRRGRSSRPRPVIGFLRPTKRPRIRASGLPQFAKVSASPGYPSDKVANRVSLGGTAERTAAETCPLNWSPFRWRRLLLGSLPSARAAKARYSKHSDYFRDRCRSADRGTRVQYQPTGRQHNRRELL